MKLPLAFLLAGVVILPLCLSAAAPATAPAPVFFPPPPGGHEARRIVFVCGVAGPTNGATLSRRELQRAVRSLVGAQSFDLILTNGDEPLLFARTLVPASERNRQLACTWLDKAATLSSPAASLSALRAAFALKPEMIDLIESHSSVDPAALLREIGPLNRNRAVRINVTALLGDLTETGWTEPLQDIARANGGVYTLVQVADDTLDRSSDLGGSMFALTPEQAKVQRIVFLCDASGSILNKYVSLRTQLERAVNALKETQSFNLIFMGQTGCTSFATKPLPATPQNKRDAATFLEDKVTPRGETEPIPALEAAFAQAPQLIFMLTDGDFPDNQAALKRIRELNKDAKVPVNTIAFVDPSDPNTDFFKLLRTIADESGGQYKLVKEDELR